MAFPLLGWAILAGAALLAAQHKAVSSSTQQDNNAPFTPPNSSDVLSGGSVAPVTVSSGAPAATTPVPVARDIVITPAPMRLRDTDPTFAVPTLVSTGASVPLAHENISVVQDPLRFRRIAQE